MRNLRIMLLFFAGLLFLKPDVSGQSQKDLDKMLFYYVDGKYEKLLDLAMKYVENDKTRRNPIPYLYVSKAYYEMSKLEEYDEDYPRAFRDAVKYAVKYRKKDKAGEYVAENEEYFDQLRVQVFEMADNYYSIGKYSKAKTWYKYLTGMDPQDWGAWFLRGVVEMRLNMRSDAATSIQTAIDGLGGLDQATFDNYMEGKAEVLKRGIITYVEYMKELGKMTEAKEVIGLGYEYFKEDNEYKMTYDEIMRA